MILIHFAQPPSFTVPGPNYHLHANNGTLEPTSEGVMRKFTYKEHEFIILESPTEIKKVWIRLPGQTNFETIQYFAIFDKIPGVRVLRDDPLLYTNSMNL